MSSLTEAEGNGSGIRYTAAEEDGGKRLIAVLRGPMRISWSAVKSAKWTGGILLNGSPAHTDARVNPGDRIEFIHTERLPVYRTKPCARELKVLWADGDLMIVDKPAGLASQSSRNHPDDSLENIVYNYLGYPDNFIYRPVNRLDKGTGGLMAVALSGHAQYLAQRMLHTERFTRRYLALTDGLPPARQGRLDMPIMKEPGATVKRIVSPEGKPSATRYRVIGERGGSPLLLLELETGRTHQIRVHLSAAGCPVRGDFLYGRERKDEFPGCFALHSAMLDMLHPLTGERIVLTSLPEWAPDLDPSVLSVDFH